MHETSWLIADVEIADVICALAAAGAATVPSILCDEARRLLEEAHAPVHRGAGSREAVRGPAALRGGDHIPAA
jgi:hypothetical protein